MTLEHFSAKEQRAVFSPGREFLRARAKAEKAEASEQVDKWLFETEPGEDVRPDPLPDKLIKLKDNSGKWIILASMTPYTKSWVKSHKGRLWRHIKEFGIPNAFITLTYSDEKVSDSEAMEVLFSENYNRFMTRLRRYLAKLNQPTPEYLRVLDYGSEKGRLHYHLCFWGLPYIPVRVLERMWEIGYVWIEQPYAVGQLKKEYPMIRFYDPKQTALFLETDERLRYHVSGLVGYLLKYLLKSHEHIQKRPKNMRAVSYSRGLKPLRSPYKVAKPHEMCPLFKHLIELKYEGIVRKPTYHPFSTFYDERELEFIDVEMGSIQAYGYDDPDFYVSTHSEEIQANELSSVGMLEGVSPIFLTGQLQVSRIFGQWDFPEEFLTIRNFDLKSHLIDLWRTVVQSRDYRLRNSAEQILNEYLRNKDNFTLLFGEKIVTRSNPQISIDEFF